MCLHYEKCVRINDRRSIRNFMAKVSSHLKHTGVQKSRKEECVSFMDGNFENVDERYCRDATKPRKDIRVCNEHPCPIW